MTTVEVEAPPGRRPELVKRSAAGPDSVRLAHEAEVLEAVRGEGVAELVGFEADDGGAELRLTWAGSHTLATVGTMRPAATASLVATLAATTARLHDLGIAHTRITADHVVVAADGRPVLCGFGAACRGDATAMDGDVVALGDLLSRLLGEAESTAHLLPDRRFGGRADEPDRAALLTLADRASTRGLGSRPSAATFGEALRVLDVKPRRRQLRLPDARRLLPDRFDAAGTVRRIGPPLAGVLAVVVLLVGAAQLAAMRERPEPSSAAPVTEASRVDRSTTTSSSTTAPAVPSSTTVPAPPVTETAAPASCARVDPPSADVDGDGCAEAFAVTGSRVSVAGVTYEVGQDGDLAAVADWNCDGQATPAVVRPSTGEVFVFAGWAAAGDDLTVQAAQVVPGASGVRPSATGSACPQLEVVRDDGTAVVVEVVG